MSKKTRPRTTAEAKKRRRHIALRARARLVAFVHLYADSIIQLQRGGAGPCSPFYPGDTSDPAVREAWVSRGGSLRWRARRPMNIRDVALLFSP